MNMIVNIYAMIVCTLFFCFSPYNGESTKIFDLKDNLILCNDSTLISRIVGQPKLQNYFEHFKDSGNVQLFLNVEINRKLSIWSYTPSKKHIERIRRNDSIQLSAYKLDFNVRKIDEDGTYLANILYDFEGVVYESIWMCDKFANKWILKQESLIER
ncbi:MAG: hypothetical protein J4G05_04655 [Chlorobi bacterium]|nr:hypothetical protein [Chlorobiota bacterium]